MSSLYKNLIFWAIIVILMVLLFQLFSKPRQTAVEKNYSDFISTVENNRVQEAEIRGKNIIWRDKEGKRFKTYAPEDPEMIKLLRDKGVVINVKKEEESFSLEYPHHIAPGDYSRWRFALFHSTDANRRWKGPLFWKE